MIKKLHFKLLLLLLAAFAGGGNLWAEKADVTYDFTGSDWTVSNDTLSNGTVSFTGEGNGSFKMNSGYFILGKSGAYINFPKYESAVEKIVVTGRSGASTSVVQNIYVGETAVSTETTGATGTNTYEIASANQAAGTQYTLKVTSNHNTQITKIEVYFAAASDPTATTTTLTIDDSGITNTDAYVNTAAGTLTATVTPEGGTALANPAITWASSNEDVATVEDGVVTLVAKGTTIITATYAGETGVYAASSDTYELTVTDSTPKTGSWEKTDLADLEEGDVFVIVGNNGSNYAMSNDNGTSSAPSAVAVTVENDEITSNVADNIKWNISGDATNGYTFYPNEDTGNWLYCTNTNNGVRVGTNDSKTFTISTEGYLYHSGTSRYVGVYNSRDWRCYTSINSNIQNQTFAFYKYVDATASQKANPELAFNQTAFEVGVLDGDNFTAPTLTTANGFDGTVKYAYTSSNEANVVDLDESTGEILIEANAEGTITVTATSAATEIFKAGKASYTITIVDNRTDAGLAWSETEINIDLNATTYTLPTLANANNVTVAYLSSNEDVAVIGATTGETIVETSAVGTATITATFAGNATYKAATASYTINIVDPNANDGSAEKPYTVAEAIAATPTTSEVYISGKVSSFYNTSIVGDGSNYRYYISDDGTTDKQLLVYKGKGLNEETFSDADDLKVGDEVVVYGNLTMYNNAPEVASGNYLTSWKRPADTTPSITLSTTSVEATAAGLDGTIIVTYNNIADVLAEVKFYEADGTTAATYDWLDAEINNDNNIDYVISANDGEARTAYLKVYALDDETNDVYSELITITQDAYEAPATTYFEKVTSTADITAGKYLIVYEDGGVAFDGNLETLDVSSNNVSVTINNNKISATNEAKAAAFTINKTAGTILSASGLYIGVSSNSNGLKQTDDASTYTHTFSIDESGNAVISAVFDGSTMSLRFNKASNQDRFRYYKNAGQEAIQLYKYIDPSIASVGISAAGYATYCSTSDLDFSNVNGLTAYKATVADKQVNFTAVEQVPAGVGVLLKGNQGVYDVPVIESATSIGDNVLIGVTEATKVDAGIFVLMNGDSGVGFYKTNNAFTVGANTAYLPATTSVRSFIGFDGETTGINNVNVNDNENEKVFDLQGRSVAQPTKGLYIVNGKKVVIK